MTKIEKLTWIRAPLCNITFIVIITTTCELLLQLYTAQIIKYLVPRAGDVMKH